MVCHAAAPTSAGRLTTTATTPAAAMVSHAAAPTSAGCLAPPVGGRLALLVARQKLHHLRRTYSARRPIR
eukprot:280641-Chlamydomonas_euryale.AAC.1